MATDDAVNNLLRLSSSTISMRMLEFSQAYFDFIPKKQLLNIQKYITASKRMHNALQRRRGTWRVFGLGQHPRS